MKEGSPRPEEGREDATQCARYKNYCELRHDPFINCLCGKLRLVRTVPETDRCFPALCVEVGRRACRQNRGRKNARHPPRRAAPAPGVGENYGGVGSTVLPCTPLIADPPDPNGRRMLVTLFYPNIFSVRCLSLNRIVS